MARPTPHEALDHVVAAVRRHRDGVGVDDVARATGIPRRSVQRYLARLVTEGRLAVEGRSRSRTYRAISGGPAPVVQVGVGEAHSEGLPARLRSPEAVEVRRLVRRPLIERDPVGYDRAFLDAYRPNRSAYLPKDLRARLHEMGRSPGGDRPAGTYARQILDRLLIDLSWASSRLEGNTYSRLDTQNLIEFGTVAEGRDQREAQMILNHKAAIEMLVEGASEIGFNRYTLLNLHAILADNLLLDSASGGRLRTKLVEITATVYQPTGVPQLIEEMFDQLVKKAGQIKDPLEQAFFAMVHLPYLQPFDDVNKRVSRLAANIPLIRANLAPLSFVDVPDGDYIEATLGVYELNRVELLRDLFAWAYERSCRRYTVLREAVAAPDPLRLRYRAVLGEVVREVVRANDPIEPARLRDRARDLVDASDVDAFLAMVVSELHQLHDGNIARYGIRPSELRSWTRRVAPRGG